MKIRPGNKQNSILNGEWAAHVRADWKKITASIRRQRDKDIIREELEDSEFIHYPKRKRKRKVWRIEESIGHNNWKPKYSKYASLSGAIQSINSTCFSYYGWSEFWRKHISMINYRVRNIETGEIVDVPKPV